MHDFHEMGSAPVFNSVHAIYNFPMSASLHISSRNIVRTPTY